MSWAAEVAWAAEAWAVAEAWVDRWAVGWPPDRWEGEEAAEWLAIGLMVVEVAWAVPTWDTVSAAAAAVGATWAVMST